MCLLSVGCAILLAFFVVNQYQSHASQQRNALSMTIISQLAAGMVDPVFTDDKLAIQTHLNQLVENDSVRSALVFTEAGEVLAAATQSTRRLKQMELWIEKNTGFFARLPARSELSSSEFLMHMPVKLNEVVGAYVMIAISSNGTGFSFATASRQLILALLGIAIFALLAALLMSRLLTQPVYRLLAVSEAARTGRVDLIDKLSANSPLANEWGDILEIYSELGREVKSNQALETLLQRFVASDVADQLVAGNQRLMLEGTRVEASVLFVDIVDFTSTAESMDPEDVALMLNRYLEIFASCARLHRGTVNKFIGDAAMIVFGVPCQDKQHRENAMACAQAIQETARQINLKRNAMAESPIELRVGINSGQMYAGTLGSEHRMEFTVVGDAVNLASRLCNACTPGEVLLSSQVYRTGMSNIKVETQGQLLVKGKAEAITTYRLLDAKTDKQWVVRGLIEDLVAKGSGRKKQYA